MTTDYAFTEGMAEISGFGGDYEQACREMVLAGVGWLDDHPDAEIEIQTANIDDASLFGIIKGGNEESVDLIETIAGAVDESPTGAMVHAAAKHVLYVDEYGWDAYVEMMEDDDA